MFILLQYPIGGSSEKRNRDSIFSLPAAYLRRIGGFLLSEGWIIPGLKSQNPVSGKIALRGEGRQMLSLLKDRNMIFFDVGYTLDAPASEDWMFTNQFLELIR